MIYSNITCMATDIARLFAQLLPAAHQHLVYCGAPEYMAPGQCKILALADHDSAPTELRKCATLLGPGGSCVALYLEFEDGGQLGTAPRLTHVTLQVPCRRDREARVQDVGRGSGNGRGRSEAVQTVRPQSSLEPVGMGLGWAVVARRRHRGCPHAGVSVGWVCIG